MKRTQPRPVAGQKVYARTTCAALFALLGMEQFSCARKAPGPDECVAFAKVWVQRQRTGMEPKLVAADPFDELVRDCLTKPYDRALVECVIQGKPPERCRVEYARREEEGREARQR